MKIERLGCQWALVSALMIAPCPCLRVQSFLARSPTATAGGREVGWLSDFRCEKCLRFVCCFLSAFRARGKLIVAARAAGPQVKGDLSLMGSGDVRRAVRQ